MGLFSKKQEQKDDNRVGAVWGGKEENFEKFKDIHRQVTAERKQQEEYYCGMCRGMVPLSSGLHPHTR